MLDLNLQGWYWSHRLGVYIGDLKRELEIHVKTDPRQRNLRVLELDLIIVVKFTTDLYS